MSFVNSYKSLFRSSVISSIFLGRNCTFLVFGSFSAAFFSGEEIRRKLSAKFPESKHVYMPRKKAVKNGDVGIENCTPEDVKKVLEKVCTIKKDVTCIFELKDLDKAGLIGRNDSKALREMVGEFLGIGYGNGNAMLKKLNTFGITREDFEAAVAKAKER